MIRITTIMYDFFYLCTYSDFFFGRNVVEIKIKIIKLRLRNSDY